MNYTDYANAVNKIFDCINRMRQSFPDPTNLGNIEKIEEYRNVVVEKSKQLQIELSKKKETVEELGEW